ncbi:thymidylate synthase [Hymenobacter sp. M29]|uniref:Thymidylate synthase n=1 Tax=Hymenobacter mellowenesis TaxID=3063995 RepID=A0ABT9ACU2_9BACT|nr:thymidylate synthase [Hymenobacter sp. M29]MDO7847651.1 thymidylate synthase [Hymenobacter sp. M29]
MHQYLDLLSKVLTEGIDTEDRTGVGCKSLFGYQMRFNLQAGLPLLTTKKVHWKSVVGELLWFLSGSTYVQDLQKNGVKIWDEWAPEHGYLGPIYGEQWRSWRTYTQIPESEIYEVGTVDQISQVLETLRTNPTSRRMVVSTWNVADLPDMALAPCHCLFQFHTSLLTQEERYKWTLKNRIPQSDWGKGLIPTRKLNCQLYQRSADVFLGIPFNIASYSLLTLMVAQCVNMVPGEFIWTGGDVHLYSSHTNQALLQLSRSPQPLPTVTLNPQIKDLFAFTYGDITLENYNPLPTIKAPVAV